ncbi:MAG TPA: DUF2231 domain-containing protein [Pyrinomonadaceae bacterium]
MESRAKLFGHALHPILIVFPLGLLSTSVIFDIIHIATGNPQWALVSFWMIISGVIGGFVAAIFGLVDFLAIPTRTRAKAVGLLHAITALSVLTLFLASWLIRYNDPDSPSTLALLLSFVGAGGALLAGWLGGELVERLGVGVDTGAHLNAPNSLKEAHATPHVREARTV